MKNILLVLACLGGVALQGAENAHRKAASEMMQASGVPAMLKRSFDAQLEGQIKALPELEKIRNELTVFYRNAFSFKELEPELAAIYMKHYTLEEMKQITAFYRTPAGRKKAQVDSRISTELGELFLKHGQKKLPELQKLLRKISEK